MQPEFTDEPIALRSLLYISPKPNAELVRGLAQLGWRSTTATSSREATMACKTSFFTIGLFETHHLRSGGISLSQLACCAEGELHWIALVSSEHLHDPEIRRDVARYCYDFCTLPIPADRLAAALGSAYRMAALRRGLNVEMQEAAMDHGIIGVSEEIKALRNRIETYAMTNAPVLIRGETGTGKELAAAAIHALSRRRDAPFIVVNCGALPHSLIQSELFGHEKGSFTGADRRTIGKFEAADKGTVFLDEIGDLAPDLQVNLLRFLQEGRVQRIGSHQEVAVEVRIIAATYVDLERAVAEGRFREDLYYRLNVLPLTVPPLRERLEDVPLLAQNAFKTFLPERTYDVKGFRAEALKAMRNHAWPGNVRELINRVRRAVVICHRPLIGANELGLQEDNSNNLEGSLNEVRARCESELLRKVLRQTKGNIAESARRLCITRTTLYRLLRKYRIESREAGAPGDGEILEKSQM